MSFISNILNGEAGSSVRSKLNTLIDRMNGDVTNKNQFIGDEAGDKNNPTGGLSGQYNSFYGFNAGLENTEGYLNTYIGARAGYTDDVGERNTGVGMDALRLMEGQDDNTVIGYEAAFKAKDGWRLTVVGSEAMEDYLVGAYGVAFGYRSQNENLVGIRNSGFGYKTLLRNLFAFDNTAIGYKALEALKGTSGAITAYADAGGGQITVTSAGHGQSNGTTVAIRGSGVWAKPAYVLNYDGSYVIANVATDTFEITAAYVNESLLASFGAWGIESEGERNTALGYYAAGLLVEGSNNIAIGYGAQLPDTAGNYQLNIGNLITGDMASGQKWAKIDGFMKLEPQAAAPASPQEGWIYSNSTDHHLYFYNGSGWVQLDN